MKPEPRDYTLMNKVRSVLEAQPSVIVKLKCFNQHEVTMLHGLVPNHLKDRVVCTYMEFYSPGKS